MHEFSLAQNIFEIIETSFQEHQLRQIDEVVLEIGHLSGIEISALEMAIRSLQRNSPYANTRFTNTLVEAEATCSSCQYAFTPDSLYTPCPKCHSFDIEITKGKELKVKSIIGE